MSQYDISLKPDKSFIVSMEVNGGTTDYNKLRNKPTINGVEVVGNLTTEDLKIEIPDVSDFATKEELLGKADKSDIPTVPTKISAFENDVGYLKEHQSLDAYALKSQLPTKTSQLTNDTGFITELPSLEGYALKSDVPTKTSQLTNDSGFITELPSLEGYALKTDIPTKTSQLTNDKGYITSSSLNGYATTEYVNNAINSSLSGISNTLDAINGEIV